MALLSRWTKRNTKKARSKKGKASSRSKRASDAPRFGWVQAKPVLIVFGVVVSLAAVSYGWYVGEPYLINYSNAHHHADLRIRFSDEPVQVEGVVDRLRGIIFENISSEPIGSHARESLQRTQELLASTGWFDPESLRVRRDFVTDSESSDGVSDLITVEGRFRIPFALVRFGGEDYLIDVKGDRLPPVYEEGSVDALPVIVGVGASEPSVGEVWEGRDVADGIGLLLYLINTGPAWLAQVREIHVGELMGSRSGEPYLVLVTDKGYRIAWGRAVGDENGIDQPPADKIRVLNEYAKQRGGRIGDPLGLLHIDQPLATLDHPVSGQGGGG